MYSEIVKSLWNRKRCTQKITSPNPNINLRGMATARVLGLSPPLWLIFYHRWENKFGRSWGSVIVAFDSQSMGSYLILFIETFCLSLTISTQSNFGNFWGHRVGGLSEPTGRDLAKAPVGPLYKSWKDEHHVRPFWIDKVAFRWVVGPGHDLKLPTPSDLSTAFWC